MHTEVAVDAAHVCEWAHLAPYTVHVCHVHDVQVHTDLERRQYN